MTTPSTRRRPDLDPFVQDMFFIIVVGGAFVAKMYSEDVYWAMCIAVIIALVLGVLRWKLARWAKGG